MNGPRKDMILIAGFSFFFAPLQKKRIMKTSPSWLVLPLAAVLSACVWIEGGPAPDGRMRSDCGRPASSSSPHPPASGQASGPSEPDTTVWLSAVRFPKDYDWQRDTAYGTAAFELILYRNFAPVLVLPSGPDACFVADPDRHHILSGRLYTERIAGSSTRVGRDGEELFRFEGREFLVGLLEDGNDLYTLSRSVSGQGFSFRKNGEILLKRADGVPFGSLDDPSYAPTGALYCDGGQTVFCFHAGNAYNGSHYLVRDGQETRLDDILPTTRVLDLKYRDGHTYVLYPSLLKSLLDEGRIWPENEGYAVTGFLSDGGGGWYSGWIPATEWSSPRRLCQEYAQLYHSPEATFAVSTDREGVVRWYGPSGEDRSQGPCLFPGPGCAAAAGGTLVLALTPREPRGLPQIRRGGRVTELDLHGYVSGVAVKISPPR